MHRGQHVIAITKVIFTELSCLVATRFEQRCQGWIFFAHALWRTGQTDFCQTCPNR